MNEPIQGPLPESPAEPTSVPPKTLVSHALRRISTRVGLGMLCYSLVMLLTCAVMILLLDLISPDLSESSAIVLVVNDIATYLFGPLALYLVIRPLRPGRLPGRSMTGGRMGKLILEGFGLMYSLSLLTELLLYAISTVTGLSSGNLLDSATESVSIPLIFLFMVIIAPICEEWIFRRLLLQRLLPMGAEAAVVLSALSFGLFHANLGQFFYATAVGLLYGCVVVKTGRIRYTILFHMLLNFFGSVVPLALENNVTATIVFSGAIYVLMILGIIFLARDMWQKRLWPSQTSPAGWKKAAFTSPGLLLFLVILGVVSIITPFTV